MLWPLLCSWILAAPVAANTVVYNYVPAVLNLNYAYSNSTVVQIPAINSTQPFLVNFTCDNSTAASTLDVLRFVSTDAPTVQDACFIPTFSTTNCSSWNIVWLCGQNTSATVAQKFQVQSTGPGELKAAFSSALSTAASPYSNPSSDDSYLYLFFLLFLIPFILACLYFLLCRKKRSKVLKEAEQSDLPREYPWVIPEGTKPLPGPGTYFPPEPYVSYPAYPPGPIPLAPPPPPTTLPASSSNPFPPGISQPVTLPPAQSMMMPLPPQNTVLPPGLSVMTPATLPPAQSTGPPGYSAGSHLAGAYMNHSPASLARS